MNTALLEAALDRMSRVFHQEADFQQALAWSLHQHFPSLTIRAEYPVEGATVDLWLADADTTMAVELKYSKKRFQAETDEETFAFGNDATDRACAGYLADIQRLETLVEDGVCDHGAAVILSNDTLLWENQPNGANYDPFKLYDGRTVSGTLAWPEEAVLRQGQDRTLRLSDEYTLDWQPYRYQYPEQGTGNTAFKYCLTSVENTETVR